MTSPLLRMLLATLVALTVLGAPAMGQLALALV